MARFLTLSLVCRMNSPYTRNAQNAPALDRHSSVRLDHEMAQCTANVPQRELQGVGRRLNGLRVHPLRLDSSLLLWPDLRSRFRLLLRTLNLSACGDDIDADSDAFVADVDRGSSDQLANLVLPLVAERALRVLLGFFSLGPMLPQAKHQVPRDDELLAPKASGIPLSPPNFKLDGTVVPASHSAVQSITPRQADRRRR